MAKDLTKKELLELLDIALRENEQLQRNTKSNERELLKAWEQTEELKDQVIGFAEMLGLSVEGSSVNENSLLHDISELLKENAVLHETLKSGMNYQKKLESEAQDSDEVIILQAAQITESVSIITAYEAQIEELQILLKNTDQRNKKQKAAKNKKSNKKKKEKSKRSKLAAPAVIRK
jgi:hypothetical protein